MISDKVLGKQVYNDIYYIYATNTSTTMLLIKEIIQLPT